MSYPQIWNTKRDREKEKVGDRSAKLNEKKSDGQRARDKRQRRQFFVGRTT